MQKAFTASGRRILRAGAGGALTMLAAVMAGHVLTPARAQEPIEPATPAASTVTPGGGQAAAPSPESGAEDAAQALRQKRDQIGRELQELSRSMQLSQEKTENLQQSIAAIAKTSESLKSALIESAARRKELERKMAGSERKLADLGIREDKIRHSFKERRAVLAEVLAALQRMGRNPPPALLVSPDDALASVRTAILLGAVVPGIRKETDRLAADLQELLRLRDEGQKEMASLVATMQSRQEEERRMDLLLVENDRLSKRNAEELETERRRSKELAERASTMEGLIASLESEISSVREAAEAARAEEEKRRQQTEEQKQKARELALSTLPDKNRIAPAYPFSELKKKLELPVAGDILRQFGDPDGTGHAAKGMVIAASAGALVTAPADAWVVFAGEFRSYGQMVILNTGDGYHVVLSGMDRISTSQGKFVLSGEPLAVMGEKRVASATGLALETDRPTLYIEFRKDGKPVDSRPWWTGNDSGKAENGT
ncbi:murein hydrolase activator EnvC family protein [Rhizobium cremeum]|uniref:murein hydrolase activator EnvC family protein n=1 Tax=Rhizobium cremeum TaxID=2813827 RepID=UPI0039DF9E30